MEKKESRTQRAERALLGHIVTGRQNQVEPEIVKVTTRAETLRIQQGLSGNLVKLQALRPYPESQIQ